MTARLTALTLVASAAMATLTGAAMAQSVTAAVPDTLVNALQDLGYKAVLEADNRGDPKIKSSTGGVNYSIYFYGCTDNIQCKDVIFTAGFATDDDPTHEALNSWNETKLLGAAYLDDDGDPNIEHFVAGLDGMSRTSFERTVQRWTVALDQFTDFIDW